ncbi:hypothetical protein [Reinekea sp. G2M2-21]|uniref:AAA family ATPase n=1 Tax=Reinekea sp. G2M2-21 TaxID=2788942 RepID=UPI0018AC773A|nr:hypothetical protein [Reinekea sp. G2M2-21]
MKIIWLHGAPAAGKLTVAKCLKDEYDFKLLHNHLTIDVSLAIYDAFGEKDFFDFTDILRRKVIAKAKELGVGCLVLTSMTCNQSDTVEIKTFLDFFAEQGIEVYPVHLTTTPDILRARCVTEERVNSSKLSDAAKLQEILDEMPFIPIAHENTLSIDNSALEPIEVAKMIVERIGLSG